MANWDDDKTAAGAGLTGTEWNNQVTDQKDRAKVESGLGAPISIPTQIGSIYIDTSNNQLYFAKGVGSSADWISADTEFPSGTQGDVIYYNGSAWVVLGAGTSGQFLKTLGAGANPAWDVPSDVGFVDPMTTRGDVIVRDATNTTDRLSIGTNGQLLSSDGTDISWQDAPISLPSGIQGDVIYYNGTDWVVLNAGTAGQVLQTNGGAANPSWVTPSVGGGASFIWKEKFDGSVNIGKLAYMVIPDELNGKTIQEVRISVLTLPTGSSLKVDVRKNGTTTTDSIFTSDVEIEIGIGETAINGVYQTGCDTVGSTVGTSGTTLDVTRYGIVSDDVLYYYITLVGSTIASTDLIIETIMV